MLKNNDANETVKLILMLIYTGLRIGELMSVEKANVHPKDGYFIAGSKTEAGTDRVIPISNKIKAYIQYFYDKAPDDGLLIDGYDGNKLLANFRRRDYYDTLEQLKIERKSPHSTRHTFASLMSRANVKPDLLQKIIGHADYSTTANIYVHKNLDDLKSAVNKL